MKKWVKVLCVVLAVVVVAGAATAGIILWNNRNAKQKDSDDIANENFVNLDEDFTDVRVTDENAAIEAAEDVSKELKLDNADTELKVADVSTFDGETYYRMQQYYKGVPVYGREAILVADKNGEAVALSSNTVSVDKGSADIKLPENVDYEQLVNSVKSLLENNQLGLKDFECTTVPEVVYYSEDGSSIRPCYQGVVSFKDSEDKEYAFEVLVDCNTYEPVNIDVVETYAKDSVSATGVDRDGQTREFTTYKEGLKYYLYDADKGIIVLNANNNTVALYDAIRDDSNNYYYYVDGVLYDEDFNEVYFTDDYTAIVDGRGKQLGTDLEYVIYFSAYPNAEDLEIATNYSKVWNDANAVSAISRVQNAYSFYYDTFNRFSFNDNGGEILVFYNDNNDGDTTNAYSYDRTDMTALSFGVDNNIAFDTVGHEFTHSVIGSIVDLPYRNQSGAINEAYADIFGEIIEDYSDGTLDNSCDWITDNYRNHIDPLSDNNPVEYKGEYWALNISIPDILSDTPLDIINLWTDNGGVHTNSTVLSHAAYLMNNGIDGNQEKRIDTELLAKIWYKSMFMLHSNETFSQCAKHVYESAQRTDGITDAQLACVKEAFEIAGLKVS